MKNKSLLLKSFVALFSAIICFSSFIRLPLGPVPIVFQNSLCVLTGTIMGGVAGILPTLLFLVAGLIGLPVYSGGTSGLGVWLSPTGGFLFGYLLGAFLAGIIAGKPSVDERKNVRKIFQISISIILAMIVLYIPGIFHFAKWMSAGKEFTSNESILKYAISVCVLPYLPGDLVKICISIPLAIKVRPMLAQYLYSSEKQEKKKIKGEENND